MDHTRSPADDKRADKIVLGRLFQEDRCPPGCANRGRRNPTNTRPHDRADTATHRSPPFGAVFQGREPVPANSTLCVNTCEVKQITIPVKVSFRV